MSYSTVEKQIHSVPEEYMDEVADFLDYLMYKIKRKEDNKGRIRKSPLGHG